MKNKNSCKIPLGLLVAVVLFFGGTSTALSEDGSRFFHSGDGRIHLVNAKSGHTFKGVYRKAADEYQNSALSSIQAVFDAPADNPLAKISLRLIEFIDFLQDRLKPNAVIRISSGWRSPAYNTRLRNAGKLAATASLHQYGMAADFEIQGVSSRNVWAYVRKLKFGGAGYYHGKLVHVDVGPARFWDETSSGVGTGLSADNKLIGLTTDYDVYQPGNEVVMRFIRMTAFPIGVAPTMVFKSLTDTGDSYNVRFKPEFSTAAHGTCLSFADIGQMMNIRWRLPDNLPSGRYHIQATFCQKAWSDMPDSVATFAFEVNGKRQR